MERKLLKNLQVACDLVTKEYQKQTKNDNIQFKVLQLLNPFGMLEGESKTDIVRQSTQVYDEYEGNEEYIHIPNVNQMLHNLQQFPVLGAFNTKSGELEGVVTIKYHENSSIEVTDPYYPKKDAKFFSITGVIVKQRKNMLHKGLGSNLYAASILGIQRYASEYPEEKIELNAVIDCTNLPSLYALSKGNKRIYSENYIGENQKLDAILDGIYTVRDEHNHLVEAPTYVIKIPLVSQRVVDNTIKDNVFSYQTETGKENYEQYEELLDTILMKIKQNNKCKITKMEDKGVGTVDYIHVDDLKIQLESMKLERNGAENIGKRRVPRRDVDKFVGPMPNFQNYIEEEYER